MGVVAMEVADSFRSRGYPHYTQAVYVYCDECGSFRVKKILSAKQWILILGGFIVVSLFMAFGVSWSGLLIIALIVCMPIMGLW